jgi:methionine synthase II (cobalamin-independent)
MPTLFRADHIGSFLRPAELLEARSSAGPDQLRQIEDQHILRVLAKQKAL